MDLLGGYNSDSSDSDSDSDSNDKVIVKTTAAAAAAAITNNAIKKNVTTTSTTSAKNNNNNNINKKINKADKKKRVIGKKLLKLSSVLPPHILNQLQQGGGGGDDTEDSSDDDNGSDNNNDESDDDNKNKKNKHRKTTPKLAPKTTTRDYSKDSGLMGMLQELSRSKSINSSSSSNKNNKQSKILGGDDDSIPTEMDSQESKTKSTETKAASSTSESSTKSTFSLGDAFVMATVETIKRKRTQQPTTTKVRNIHGNVGSSQETQKDLKKEKQQQEEEEDSSDRIISSSSTISAVPRVSSTPLYTNRLPRPSTSTIAPPLRGRGMATSSLRPSAPHSGHSSTTSSSNYYNTYTPVTQSTSTSTSTSTASNTLGGGGGVGGKGKKKLLSRKRQMEQMLRAGRLDEVQGDHELQGVAHIYNAPSEYGSSSGAAATAAAVDSIRVVPTGAYDPATGTTSTSRDVTGTQKNKNQLNSLLANAAALENHRMQIGGTSNTANAYKATAKRKYGW
jgi:hypothetical protein